MVVIASTSRGGQEAGERIVSVCFRMILRERHGPGQPYLLCRASVAKNAPKNPLSGGNRPASAPINNRLLKKPTPPPVKGVRWRSGRPFFAGALSEAKHRLPSTSATGSPDAGPKKSSGSVEITAARCLEIDTQKLLLLYWGTGRDRAGSPVFCAASGTCPARLKL